MSDATDYGPLKNLIGVWQGDKGTDIAPEPDGTETNPFYETITFEAGGDLKNAEKQKLAIVPYRQVVHRKSNNEVFHFELGFWLWDADNQLVMQSLTIPRAVSLVAGGQATAQKDGIALKVQAADGDADWGISQAPFMRDNAKTVSFEHIVEISSDRFYYWQKTVLDIYGRPFDHTDENTLTRADT